ncbi:cytochrome P450 [Flagelloscypha sp. PMI_526]|nr:cytochrome P450 [Flagelloscypha sp. PMI_526]
MHSLSREDLTFIAAFFGTTAAYFLHASRSLRNHKPPGPKSYPLIGSLLEWPHGQEWITYTKWRDLYGDINYLKVAGTDIVILNSIETANALLNARGTVNSDRPYLHLAHGIIGWRNSPIMCNADAPILKPARQMMLSAVGSNKALEGYISMVEYEAHRFVYRVASDPDPDRLEYYLRKYAGTIILKLVYGYDVKSGHDEYVELIEAVNQDITQVTTPGNFAVDIIPALAYLPLDDMRTRLDAALTKPVDFVKEQLAAGTAQPSFVARELENPRFSNSEHIAWTAEALFSGGADSSVSVLRTFFLCMVLYPEAQIEAQKELDAVIGQDTLPTWKDRNRLPYTNALIKEALRWFPVGPQGLPHCSNADDTYKGYFIPKKTILIANIWGFTRDSKIYPDPEAFLPSRFLDPSPQLDPGEYVFGFGRRVCAGRLLSERIVFSAITRVLSTMNIRKMIGPDGKPITPKFEYTGSVMPHLSKFEYEITLRSEKAKSLMMTVVDEPYGC